MKCTGECGKESPDQFRPGTGYGRYFGDKLKEWVCEKCWEKGVRHEDTKKKS